MTASPLFAGSVGVIATDSRTETDSREEIARLRREKEQWGIEKRILELKVQKLQRQLWDRKSERMPRDDDKQRLLFDDPTARDRTNGEPATESSAKPRQPSTRKGPKPLDPALPREVIEVPAPGLTDLICPATGKPMQPGFTEQLEVLARRAPEYFVKRYERTVFVSPAKTAPVYSPWPADVLPRARMHASVVAHIAAAHYCEHLPFYAGSGIKGAMPGGGLCRVRGALPPRRRRVHPA